MSGRGLGDTVHVNKQTYIEWNGQKNNTLLHYTHYKPIDIFLDVASLSNLNLLVMCAMH